MARLDLPRELLVCDALGLGRQRVPTGEVVQSVAERRVLGLADRARRAVFSAREMVACPTSRSVRYFSPP
ncbi:hypothetical protein [Streptomyces olivochromogenes]|uniref:hypothetical protein n=1 Tax=Streptomyces olivochromogenes TaxID=1963 RepID=UPI00367D38B3